MEEHDQESKDCGESTHGASNEEISDARNEVSTAVARQHEAEEQLEEARNTLEQITEVREELQKLEGLLAQQREALAQRDLAREELERQVEESQQLLAELHAALEQYLQETPGALEAYSFLTGENLALSSTQAIMPEHIVGHFRELSGPALGEVSRYICETDPGMRQLVDTFADRLHQAATPLDKAAVMTQCTRNLSGELGEKLVCSAMAPLCKRIETQNRTYLDNGRYTKIDLVLHDLKTPLVLGRGPNMGAPVGGSVALEVKCGRAPYILQQQEHLKFQAKGHKICDAHATLCTRDIHNLPPEKERQLRDSVRSAGSPLIAVLPHKKELDQLVWKCIEQRKTEKYGN